MAGVVWCGLVLLFCCPEPLFLFGITHCGELSSCSLVRTSTLLDDSDGHICNDSTWKMGTSGSIIQSDPQLQNSVFQKNPSVDMSALLLTQEARTQGLIWACLVGLPVRLLKARMGSPKAPLCLLYLSLGDEGLTLQL